MKSARYVVLPGVGSFGAGMASLRRSGLDRAVLHRLRENRPVLGICLGMQLLCCGSEEAPGQFGLGWVSGRLERFRGSVTVPQLGWNTLSADTSCRLVGDGAAYFANSYRLKTAPSGFGVATSDHGGRFVAALERGRMLACQMHPELSGAYGNALLRRWLDDTPAPKSTRGAVGPRVIPCLDVRDGRVVKGIRFRGLRDAGDPVEQALAYASQGADELVMLDISATAEGRRTAVQTCSAIRKVLPIPLTVGGGVRSVDDARRLLEGGADKIAVNTAAVRRPALLEELAAQFGSQCVVVSIDVERTQSGWSVVTGAGTQRTGLDAVDFAREATRRGAGEVLLTSIDRDGTGDGYDLDLIGSVAPAVSVPVIASGGGRTPGHLAAAVRRGASAVLLASVFHDGETTVGAVKRALNECEGLEVRL